MSLVEADQPSKAQPRPAPESRELLKWQRNLLPFTTRFLIVIAIAFFLLSMFDVYQMRKFVKDETVGEVRAKIEAVVLPRGPAVLNAEPTEIIWKSLLLMEADAMDKRYRHASALLMSRIWTRQLAFMTGMVLTFIGAVFILSKLSNGRTDVSVGAQDWKTGISSTSPGLVLAFFGTILLGISLVYQPKIEVQDRPIYFAQMGLMSAPPAPQNMDEPRTSPLPRPKDPFVGMPKVPGQ